MSQREQLVENFEDAFIALFMSDVAEHEGEKIIEENEELKRDASFALSPELEDRCLKTISKADRRKRGSRAGSAGKKIYGVFSKLSVAAVIAMALFTTAYAAFPEVRVSTLNLLIEVSDIATELSLVDDDSANEGDHSVETPNASAPNVAGYVLPESIISEYELIDESNSEVSAQAAFIAADGSAIRIRVQLGSGSVVSINTEDAVSVQEINLGNFEGLIVEQSTGVIAGIADMDKTNFILITISGMDFNSSVTIINEFLSMN